MTEQVLVQVKGIQRTSDEPDPEPVELIAAGQYQKKDGEHYITYDEITEGFSQSTHNTVRIRDDLVTVSKEGLTNAEMVFIEGQRVESLYETPFGILKMAVKTSSIQTDIDDHNIRTTISYFLDYDAQSCADCSISINIKSMDSKDFSLI